MAGVSEARQRANGLVAAKGVVAAGIELGVAAVLYTYRCTIACRHCCFGCAGERPSVRMGTDQAVARLRALHELGRAIHVAGGECMMYWDDLKAVLAAAPSEGAAPHFIETNCSFATDDDIVHERLEYLRARGVAGILLSADPYHQAFVPPERFLRVRRLAREAFGPANVWCPNDSDEQIRAFADIARDEHRLREHVRARPPVLVGTAWEDLRQYLDDYPLAEMPLDAGWRVRYRTPGCRPDFARETIWEIHIDPYDNLQTNCGVILGSAAETTPAELMARGPEAANEIVRLLAGGGPFALAEMARTRHGFRIPPRAHSKCALCYQARKFLRPHYPHILGPAEVYGGG